MLAIFAHPAANCAQYGAVRCNARSDGCYKALSVWFGVVGCGTSLLYCRSMRRYCRWLGLVSPRALRLSRLTRSALSDVAEGSRRPVEDGVALHCQIPGRSGLMPARPV
jgi:hypothetical protein